MAVTSSSRLGSVAEGSGCPLFSLFPIGCRRRLRFFRRGRRPDSRKYMAHLVPAPTKLRGCGKGILAVDYCVQAIDAQRGIGRRRESAEGLQVALVDAACLKVVRDLIDFLLQFPIHAVPGNIRLAVVIGTQFDEDASERADSVWIRLEWHFAKLDVNFLDLRVLDVQSQIAGNQRLPIGL